MISPELRAEIRRLFFGEHWPVGTIASELHVHPDAVHHVVDHQGLFHTLREVRPSILDSYKPWILDVLEKHPRLRATRLFAMVRARGYSGSVVQLRRYVRTVRPRRHEAYFKLRPLPGEQAQVDWANFGRISIGHARRALSCFVLVLSWSRALFARFFLDQTLESFLRGHVEAFGFFGGVPRSALYDNLKSVVLERIGDHIRFHPRFLEMAGHYHFAPKPCAPYRGNEKGRAERTIQYVRHSFFAARSFSSVSDLNAQLLTWIETTAHVRKVPTDPSGNLVHEAFEEERTYLLPLPEHPFESDRVLAVRSGKTPYIRFDLNDYSIPHDWTEKPLTLAASETLVRILHADQELARHARSYDRGQTIEDPAHLAALAREKRRAQELRGRDRVINRCSKADAFFEALALRGEPLASHSFRLGKLLDRYGAEDLDSALADALSRGAISAASVAHILDQRAHARKRPPPLDPVLPDDPRVRDLRLTPHNLKPYDALSNPDEEEDPK